MEYVMAAWIAVVFLITLALIREVKKCSASIRTVENSLSNPGKESHEHPVTAWEKEIPEEVVAAISAAVFCLDPGVRIRSVRRAASKPRSAWQMAGLLENTRPF